MHYVRLRPTLCYATVRPAHEDGEVDVDDHEYE